MFQKAFYRVGVPALAVAGLLFAAGAGWAGGGHGGGGHGGGGHGGGGHGGGGHGGHGGGHGGEFHGGRGFGGFGFYSPYWYGGWGGYGGYSYPYYGYGYSDYGYPNYNNYYYNNDYYYNSPRPYYYDPYAQSQSYNPGPAVTYITPPNSRVPSPANKPTDNAVVFNVRVPPNAEIWFEGNKTAQTGADRVFESPPLNPGVDYSYEVRAKWMDNGRVKDETRKLTVRAGDSVSVNFMPAVP